jgi:hypothetical protein
MHTMDFNPREIHETGSENPGRVGLIAFQLFQRDSAVLSPARASLISLKIVRS